MKIKTIGFQNSCSLWDATTGMLPLERTAVSKTVRVRPCSLRLRASAVDSAL